MWRAAAAGAAAMVLLAGRQAAAQPAPLLARGQASFTLERRAGAETCDTEPAFHAWIAKELGGDPFVPRAAATASVHITAARAGDGFETTLVVADAAGAVLFRDVRAGRTCNDALDRTGLVVVFDLFRQGAPAGEAPPPCDPCAARDELRRLREEVTLLHLQLARSRVAAQEIKGELEGRLAALENAVSSRMDVSFALPLSAFMTLGLTNDVGAGALVGGEIHSGIFAMGLEARFTFPSEFKADDFPKNKLDYSRIQGGLVPCVRYWYIFGCAVLTAGVGIDHNPELEPSTGFSTVWEIGPRLGGELPLMKPLALRLWAEVLFNPYPTNYVYRSEGVVLHEKQLPSAAGFVGASVVFRFGNKDEN